MTNSTLVRDIASDSLRSPLISTLGVMILRLSTALILALGTISASASGQSCTKDDELRLSKELKNLKTWQALHRSSQKFSPLCDDGFIAEGYTDAVVVLLSRNWTSVRTLAVISKSDPKFQAFALGHIDASANPVHLKRIQTNASTRCPRQHESLCTAIHLAATAAIKEL